MKLSVPMALCLVAGFVLEYTVPIKGWGGFMVKGGLFVGSYALIMFCLAMNSYEKTLILSPVRKIFKK